MLALRSTANEVTLLDHLLVCFIRGSELRELSDNLHNNFLRDSEELAVCNRNDSELPNHVNEDGGVAYPRRRAEDGIVIIRIGPANDA